MNLFFCPPDYPQARITNLRRFIVLLSVLNLLVASTVSAQSASSPQVSDITIEGVVHDSVGQPVADASVALLGAAENHLLGTKSNTDGKFSFTIHQVGSYKVLAEKSGFLKNLTDSIYLAPGQKRQLDLLLQSAASSTGTMEFDDQPNFTVAGVTDWSGAGGHGSDATLRTSEAFARETLALKAGEPGPMSASSSAPAKSSSPDTAMETKLRAEVAAAPENADLHRQLGDLEERMGDPVGAVREFERATALDASEQNYFEWGSELLLHRAIAPAVTVFKKGALAHPKSSRLYVGLGASQFSAGSYDEAARDLCHASELDPGNRTAYLFLGKMDVASPASFPCVEERLAYFLKNQPADAMANFYFAMSLMKKDREAKTTTNRSQAQALLEKSVALDPKFGEAYMQLGTLYSAEGATDKAIAAYSRASEVSPHLSEPHYRLSQIYKRTGEKAKADAEIELYKQVERTEADIAERQRREIQQFLIILKDSPGNTAPQ